MTKPLYQTDLDDFFLTKAGTWDKMVMFSPKDASELLGIPQSTLYTYLRSGEIKAYKIGRHYRITRRDLYRFVENNLCLSVQ